jgi:hypothetical protein
MLAAILIVLLVLYLLGYVGHGRANWGWGTGGDIGSALITIILIIVVLRLLGVL